MRQTETGNSWWWQVDLLVEVQGNEKAATKYYCSSHYNIDEQSLHQEILEHTSVSKEERSISIIDFSHI